MEHFEKQWEFYCLNAFRQKDVNLLPELLEMMSVPNAKTRTKYLVGYMS